MIGKYGASSGLGSDEVHIFFDHFVAAKALIAIGDSSLCAIEAKLASGAPTAADAQLDGLMYSWIAGIEATIEFLESRRAAASKQASGGYNLALEVVKSYDAGWCFDGERLIPQGTLITLIIEEYREEQEEN